MNKIQGDLIQNYLLQYDNFIYNMYNTTLFLKKLPRNFSSIILPFWKLSNLNLIREFKAAFNSCHTTPLSSKFLDMLYKNMLQQVEKPHCC